MNESFARIDDFGKPLAYLESGRVKVDEIVSDEFALRDWERALENAWKRRGIKSVMILPQS